MQSMRLPNLVGASLILSVQPSMPVGENPTLVGASLIPVGASSIFVGAISEALVGGI